MCGRFVGFRAVEQLKQNFPIDEVNCETVANYNVAPTQQVLAIATVDGSNVLDQYHWGLVPFWANDKSIGYKLINARSETVAQKPSFKEAFKKRRCLIPAEGFYEWTGRKGNKQPVFITLPDKSPFAFAGLWEIWNDKIGQAAPYKSCTIITREATGAIRKIHHRMPVILDPAAYSSWLDPEIKDAEMLNNMIHTKALADFDFHYVDKRVNSAMNNDPSNMKPIQMEFDF